MRNLKRFAALVLCAALVMALGGCADRGGDFSLGAAVGEAPQTLDPIYAQRVSEQTIIAHLYENLMKLNVDADGQLTAVPGMAKSVDQEANADGTVTYTFRLRSAKWSDGRSVKAEDFIFAWQRLVDPASDSPYANLLQMVCGYDEARASGDMSLLQVTAKNDSTLVVTLKGSYDWFLTQVCTAPATSPLRKDKVPAMVRSDSAEAVEVAVTGDVRPWWDDVTALVGNGAYLISSYTEGESIQLTANQDHYYYGKQANPTEVTLYFGSAAQGAALYESGQADVAWPMTEEAYTLLSAEEDFSPTPTLSTYVMLFNISADPFRDQAIRQAVVKSLNRTAIAAAVGVTARAASALVPYGVPDSEAEDFRTCAGELVDTAPEQYEQDCADAMELLRQAGYESGADFGELRYLYVEEDGAAAAAEEVCTQLRRALRMQVMPAAVTEEELLTAIADGTFTLAGRNLTAHCNDAESFLLDWASHSENNLLGYENSAYDTLMSIIANAPDGTARLGCLHDAEELLMADAPLTPLYTTYTAWTVRETLTGVIRDPRGWFSFCGALRRQA